MVKRWLIHSMVFTLLAAMIGAKLVMITGLTAVHEDHRLLAETIMDMRALAQTADDTGKFTDRLISAVASLKTAAGLKPVLKTDSGRDTAIYQSVSDIYGLIANFYFSPPKPFNAMIVQNTIDFKSLDHAPTSPPPRVV